MILRRCSAVQATTLATSTLGDPSDDFRQALPISDPRLNCKPKLAQHPLPGRTLCRTAAQRTATIPADVHKRFTVELVGDLSGRCNGYQRTPKCTPSLRRAMPSQAPLVATSFLLCSISALSQLLRAFLYKSSPRPA